MAKIGGRYTHIYTQGQQSIKEKRSELVGGVVLHSFCPT